MPGATEEAEATGHLSRHTHQAVDLNVDFKTAGHISSVRRRGKLSRKRESWPLPSFVATEAAWMQGRSHLLMATQEQSLTE